MTALDRATWEIKPHTAAKHEILRRYLGAWFGIMGHRAAGMMYIDGFCGPGRYSKGEPGSPIVAIEVANGAFRSQSPRKSKLPFY